MALKAKALQILPQARIDLEEIYQYSISQWSVRTADAYQSKLTAALLALASGARFGRTAGVGEGYLGLSVERHIIFFRETRDLIVIVRVLHGMMDVDRHLES